MLCRLWQGRARTTISRVSTALCCSCRRVNFTLSCAAFTALGLHSGESIMIHNVGASTPSATYDSFSRFSGRSRNAQVIQISGTMTRSKFSITTLGGRRQGTPQHLCGKRMKLSSRDEGLAASVLPRWGLLEGGLEDFIAMSSAAKYVLSSRSPGWEEDWLRASGDLADSLGIDPSTAAEVEHRRVFHLYLPIFFWLKGLLRPERNGGGEGGPQGKALSDGRRRNAKGRPLLVGVSAPQGCGKTTLVEEMRRMLEKAGHSCAVLSIDDFYLTRKDQDALAAKYPENPLLQFRGNAGTHDLSLGMGTIRALKGACQSVSPNTSDDPARKEGMIVRVPRYDKSAGGGRGDRAPAEDWVEVAVPLDIVLLEGWMLGFEALAEDSEVLAKADGSEGADRGLREVNNFLRNYQELHDEVDAWLVLKTADPEMVYEWRAEAENKMRASGRPGMSEEEVRDFCSRYMPSYRAYLPGLYETMERRQALSEGGQGREHNSLGSEVEVGEVRVEEGKKEALVIEVGRDRNPVL